MENERKRQSKKENEREKRAIQRCSIREWEVEVKRKNERVNERDFE